MTDRPWMTAIEMQYAAMRTAAEVFESYRLPPGEHPDPLEVVPGLLRHAETFAWEAEPARAVTLAAKTIPGSAMPMPSWPRQCWWWFDEPLPFEIGISAVNGDDKRVYALSVGRWEFPDGEAGVMIHTYGMVAGDGVPIATSCWQWRERETVAMLDARLRSHAVRSVSVEGIRAIEAGPADHNQSSRLAINRFIVAAMAWLEQRIITVASGPIERHRRKQLARENHTPIVSDVKIVQLRRAESEPAPQPADGGGGVDWSCRWIVGGHWRKQPYREGVKVIFISPYVKGPADRPLRVPTHTVFEVKR